MCANNYDRFSCAIYNPHTHYDALSKQTRQSVLYIRCTSGHIQGQPTVGKKIPPFKTILLLQSLIALQLMNELIYMLN